MKLVEVQVGSRMWGLERPDSDKDTRSVVARSFSEIVSPWQPRAVTQDQREDGTDRVTYDLQRFCKLAVNGNSTMMEVLFAGERNTTFRSQFWEDVDPHWFVDEERVARAHLGFADSQRDQIVPLWHNKGANGKRIGKALSSGILTLRSGVQIIKMGDVSHILDETEVQFHRDLRMGYRLTEGSEELDVWKEAMEHVFSMLPKQHKTADTKAIEKWLADFYAGMAYWERWPDRSPGIHTEENNGKR